MQKQLNHVKEWHEKFFQENGKEPQLLPENDFMLRHRLMEEENEEYASWELINFEK